MFFGIFLLTVWKSICVDLICNGDFETYQTPRVDVNRNRFSLPLNDECWRNANGSKWEVKRKPWQNQTTAAAAQLITTNPYSLCQDLDLGQNFTYIISFTTICPQRKTYCKTICTLNRRLIIEFEAFEEYSFDELNETFTSYANETTICFRPIVIPDNNYGSLIDNVSIIVLSMVIRIDFIAEVDENKDVIVFNGIINSQTAYSEQMFVNHLINNTNSVQCIVEGTTYQIQITELTVTNISFNLYPSQISSMLNTQIIFPSEILDESSEIDNYISTTYEIKILQNYTQKVIVIEEEEGFDLGAFVANSVKQSHNVMKSSFSSFLILSIISFWSSCLLFNFVHLRSRPEQVRELFEVMSIIIFKLNGVLAWFIEVFSLPEDTFDFLSQKVTEQLQLNKNNHKWFGQMGLSTNTFNNNFESLLMLFFLTVKMFIFNLILQRIPEEIQKKYCLKVNYLKVFLAEVVSMMPGILISSTTSLQNISSLNFTESIVVVCQILLIFFCTNCICFSFIRSDKWKFNRKKRDAIRRQRNQLSAQYMFYFALPILIVFNIPVIFLLPATVIISLRAYLFRKNITTLSISQKIYGICIHSIWILIVLIYNIFLLMDMAIKDQLNQGQQRFAQFLGILLIGIVFAGGIIEVIFFFVDLFKGLFQTIKKCCKENLLKRKIAPEGSKVKMQTMLFDQSQANFSKDRIDCKKSFKKSTKVDAPFEINAFFRGNTVNRQTNSVKNKTILKERKEKVKNKIMTVLMHQRSYENDFEDEIENCKK